MFTVRLMSEQTDCRRAVFPAPRAHLLFGRSSRSRMSFTSTIAFILPVSLSLLSFAQSSPPASPPRLRVGIVGLVHGHVRGFFEYSSKSPEIEIVGIAEPDPQLLSQAGAKYGIDHSKLFSSLEEMIAKAHPQAVLAYTNTYDHRKVVETCARHGVHIMMEKPLAISFEDALAMQKVGQEGHIHVLVNYETSWYRSNYAAYDLVHEGALGDVRKVVVHDGHAGPKERGVQPEFLAWLIDPKLNGAGALFDFGCYGADLMTWLMNGQRPLSVTAATQQIKPGIYSKVDDEATIILTYPKAQAILQASWNWPYDRSDLEVYGATGYVKTAGGDNVRMRLPGGDEQQVPANPIPAPDNDSLTYLRAVVLNGKKPEGPSSLSVNIIVAEILDAARRSAAT